MYVCMYVCIVAPVGVANPYARVGTGLKPWSHNIAQMSYDIN